MSEFSVPSEKHRFDLVSKPAVKVKESKIHLVGVGESRRLLLAQTLKPSRDISRF